MSKGPTGVTENGFNTKKYLNFKLTPNDWCSFRGKCRINQVAFGAEHICDTCIYKRLVDVPEILERMNNGDKKV